jgi:TetR/AcrR family transcriptional repressor of nem operon
VVISHRTSPVSRKLVNSVERPPMRYCKDRKLQTRARIIKEASHSMRESGVEVVSIDEVMRLVGLTHGGFYNHFRSRDELVIEAFNCAMDESIARWSDRAAAGPPGNGLELIVDAYLSPAHRDKPGLGCALPAMATSIARSGKEARSLLDYKLDGLVDLVACQLINMSSAAARQAARGIVSTMVGSILLARAAGKGAASDEILNAGRIAARNLASGSETLITAALGKKSDRVVPLDCVKGAAD